MAKKYKLPKYLIEESISNTWDEARKEWYSAIIYDSERIQKCLCGHDIRQVCVIHNKHNNKMLHLGNCCIKLITGDCYVAVFQNVRRVKEKIQASFNPKSMDYFYAQNFVNEWEYNFYASIWRKRVSKLSVKQNNVKVRINRKILVLWDNNRCLK